MSIGLFISHMGLGDILLLLPAIVYYSKISTILYLFCKTNYNNTIKDFLIDYSNIEIISIPHTLNDIEQLHYINNEITVIINKHPNTKINAYKSGFLKQKHNIFIDFPVHFYKDLDLDFNTIFPIFNVPITTTAKLLYNIVKSVEKPYYFIHSSASNFELNIYINTSNMDIIFINPEKNMYDKTHIYYEIAEKCIRSTNNYTLLDYTIIIQHADELHLIDSSYFCLAMLCAKDIHTTIKNVYSRYEQNFTSLLKNTLWKQHKLM